MRWSVRFKVPEFEESNESICTSNEVCATFEVARELMAQMFEVDGPGSPVKRAVAAAKTRTLGPDDTLQFGEVTYSFRRI